MTTITFDTHEFVKLLVGSGLTEQQAEIITDLQLKATTASIEQARHDYHFDELATKRDLKELENSAKHEMDGLRRDMREMEQRMTIKLGGMMMAAVAIVAALVKLL